MKRLLIILILFINCQSIIRDGIILKKLKTDDNDCYYYLYDNGINLSQYIKFKDDCDCYDVGDTVIYTKN